MGALASNVHAQRASASDAEDRALSLFEESATAYREGRFADAAALLREAYALHEEPVLLYNLARALDAEGELDDALDAYERFLEASPDAEQAPLARRRVEVIAEQIVERDALAAEAEARESEPREPDDVVDVPRPAAGGGPDLLGPALTLSLGGAATIAGAVLLGVASATHSAAFNEPIHLNAARLERDAYAYRDAGAVVLAIGGAVAIAGAIWLIVAAGEGGPAPSAALRLGPGVLELSGTF